MSISDELRELVEKHNAALTRDGIIRTAGFEPDDATLRELGIHYRTVNDILEQMRTDIANAKIARWTEERIAKYIEVGRRWLELRGHILTDSDLQEAQ